MNQPISNINRTLTSTELKRREVGHVLKLMWYNNCRGMNQPTINDKSTFMNIKLKEGMCVLYWIKRVHLPAGATKMEYLLIH